MWGPFGLLADEPAELLLCQKLFRRPFTHLFLKYCIDRTVWVSIWYGYNTVMQGVSQYIGHCRKMVVESDDIQVEVELFSDSPVSLVFMVEVFGV